ncbi:MAG: GntR family transcriptional regulator [Thermoleophilia bacterium]
MAERGLRAEAVYRRLRADLLGGRIRPGDRVTEHWAADNYRVSRTPVREACRRLAEEGLLTHRPRHGYSAPLIDRREIEELYDVRRALEVLSVRRAAEAEGSRAALLSLRRTWSAPMPEPAVEVVYRDEAFHMGIARAGGGTVLASMLDGVNARIRLVRVHDFLDRGRILATVEQHLAILEAVEDRDAEAAADLMDAHIRESARVVHAAAGRALAELWTT